MHSYVGAWYVWIIENQNLVWLKESLEVDGEKGGEEKAEVEKEE